MKIAIFVSKSRFTKNQISSLSKLGQVVFTEEKKELPLNKLLEISKSADIIAPDPDVFGGFEKAKNPLTKAIESLPNLKGVCLSTTSFGWVDLDYCKKRKLPVCNVPGYSRESVAEHALALMLGLAKRIFVSDRDTQMGRFKIKMGFELKGKTLGIIGLGNIGSRVAELGLGIGMKVIAYNRTPMKKQGVIMKPINEVLSKSDVISLHTTHEDKNKHMISDAQIKKMKDGVIVVNTVDRDLVDEKAMAKAIKSGKVYGYGYEGEDLVHTPLVNVSNAIGIKGFAWFTKEALENLHQIWTDNIIALAKGAPRNRVI
jgi:lactate dehydrogenase-like 2-hydroxyacid dehydrogenase